MNFEQACALKQTLSQDFIFSRKIRVFAVAKSPSGRTIGNLNKVINGVGVSRNESGEYLVHVYTEKTELSASTMARYLNLKREEVRIRDIGPITTLQTVDRCRPYQPGYSVGHFDVTAGTLGCFVKDEHDTVCIMGNNHILANINQGKIGDCILQPGAQDGGLRPQDRIAELYAFKEIDTKGFNRLDWALAKVDNHLDINSSIPGIGRISGTNLPILDMIVTKYGRTTELTTGRISAIDADIKVDYGEFVASFENQIEVQGVDLQYNKSIQFAGGGDSGALVVEKESNKAVGLLFGGTEDGTSFVNPIGYILDHRKMEFL